MQAQCTERVSFREMAVNPLSNSWMTPPAGIRQLLGVLCAAGLFCTAVPPTYAIDAATGFNILPASILRSEGIELTSGDLLPTGKIGWQGLVCNATATDCELRPIRLDIEKSAGTDQFRVRYPSAGRRKSVKGEFTIALLSGPAAAVRRRVPTWFTLHTPRAPQDAVNGSLGVTIPIPGQRNHHIVPRWREDARDRSLNLYVETEGQRQALGRIGLDVVNAGLKPSDLLIWAGDIDGDGKVDLITRAGDDPGKRGLRLWLSSRARPGEMVGLAAALNDWADIDEAVGC